MYSYLNQIHSPSDLKQLKIEELEILAGEIRAFLIDQISHTGGHLSSNLGVVELTIALHYVFDSPNDKIIWDVSHQSYVHKILTGRKDLFSTLRQTDGLSGFTKRAESQHDVFDTGHSSTSISAAVGMAIARDLNEQNHEVMSIIGDGALTGGMAFEALNHLGHREMDMKVILNDNAMSISENIGGLSQALNKLRVNKTYRKIKLKSKLKLSRSPVIGSRIVNSISKFKASMKHFLVNGGYFFEDLNITYLGPIDGHDLKKLIEYFQLVKGKKGPLLLHVVTEKGRGYSHAEKHPERYHGVGKFDPDHLIELKAKTDYSAVFGNQITELAKSNPKIVAVSAAMIDGTGLSVFQEAFPKRIFDVGICEQHAVTMAAGLATQGFKPFVAIYSTFLQRAFDQILHDVCIQELPVVFAVDRAGIVGNDGETHHGIFDIAYLNAIPNLTLLSPRDKVELEEMLVYASQYNEGPIAIRYPRGEALSLTDSQSFSLLPECIKKGNNTVVVTTGKMVDEVIQAASLIEKKMEKPLGIIHIRQIKPLHKEALKAMLLEYDHIITVEDHSVVGGLGDIVLDVLKKEKRVYTFHKLGYQDTFVPQGDIKELLERYNLSGQGLIEKILEAAYEKS